MDFSTITLDESTKTKQKLTDLNYQPSLNYSKMFKKTDSWMDKLPTPPLGEVEQNRQSIYNESNIDENDLITGNVVPFELETSLQSNNDPNRNNQLKSAKQKATKTRRKQFDSSTEEDTDPFDFLQEIKRNKKCQINGKQRKTTSNQKTAANKSNKYKRELDLQSSTSSDEEEEPNDQIKTRKQTQVTTMARNKRPITRGRNREKK